MTWLATKPRGMGAIPLGGGKTRTTLEHIASSAPGRILVVCPPAVISTWRREVQEWGLDWPTLELDNSMHVTRRAELLAEAGAATRMVAITNYDVVWRPEMKAAMKRYAPDLVVMDESHRAKKPTGKIAKALYAATRGERDVLQLTGRPMPHSPLDLWAQYRILDDSVYGRSYPAFRARYAVLGGPHNNWVRHLRIQRSLHGKPNPDYDPELTTDFARRMGSMALIVPEAEVKAALKAAGMERPDLAPAQYRTHPLPPPIRGAYEHLYQYMVLQVEDGVVTTDNALVHLLRLAQLASGSLPLDNGGNLVHSEREQLLADLLSDVPATDRVVAFCRFHHELDAVRRVAEANGRTYAELSGRGSDALDRNGCLAEGVDLAGVQIQSGKEGVDLSRANGMVFYGHTYSLGDYDQCIAREDRPGQDKVVWVVHLLAEASVDQRVYTALTQRREVVADVLHQLTEET